LKRLVLTALILALAGCGASVESLSRKLTESPQPKARRKAAERLGLAPARCVVVEDAIPGVAAAKAGGFKCIAVATTNDAAMLREKAAPDLVLAATAEVTPAVVTRLLVGS